MYKTDDFKNNRPNVGVTVVVFKYEEGVIKTKVYKRNEQSEVFPNFIALPNTFYDITIHNNLEEAAKHALRFKTNIDIPFFEQLETFSGSYIDPDRINTVNISYIAIINESDITEVTIENKNFEDNWLEVEYLINNVDMAFNHKEVLISAYNRLKSKAEYTPIACHLLGNFFSIKELKELTEILINDKLDNSRFRDRIKKSDMLLEVEGAYKKGANRPAQLYSLNHLYSGFFYPKSLTKPN